MASPLNYEIQKEFLVLSTLKDLESKDVENITSEKIISKMKVNLMAWEQQKDRKSNDVKALVSGTLSNLRTKGTVKQLNLEGTNAPIYKTTDATASYFTKLEDQLLELLDFQHIFDKDVNAMSEGELKHYFENEYKYDIEDSKKMMLTDADIKRLAFQDYLTSHSFNVTK